MTFIEEVYLTGRQNDLLWHRLLCIRIPHMPEMLSGVAGHVIHIRLGMGNANSEIGREMKYGE